MNAATSGILAFTLACAVVMGHNAKNDPFNFYGFRDGGGFSENQRYQNPGLIRDYSIPADTILIGTSRSENFTPGMFVGWNVLKLTASGSTSYEQFKTMSYALKKRELDRVLVELSYDSYSLGASYRRQDLAFPEYLYEDRFETMFTHLLSLDLFQQSQRRTAGLTKQVELEDLNVWQPTHDEKFGKNLYLENKTLRCDWSMAYTHIPNQDFPLIDEAIEANLESLIKQNPETDFFGFLPPFPIFLLGISNYTTAQERSYFESKMYELDDRYENFLLFDFALLETVVSDPANYKDFTHYSQQINRKMAFRMKGEQLRAVDYAAAAKIRQEINQRAEWPNCPVPG